MIEGWRIAVALASFIVSVIGTHSVRVIALRRRLLDHPNDRSAHVRPTPRLGGIGIMSGFLPAAIAVAAIERAPAGTWTVLAATAAISALGLMDDLRTLSPRVRLGAQLVAACVVVGVNARTVAGAWTLLPLPLAVALPVSVFWIVWMTNLYNFMDGIDGLAGGQTAIAGAAIAVAAFMAGATVHGALALVLAAAACGFLLLNFPPASIFMGDVGSTAIGFFVASVLFIPPPAGVAPLPVEVVVLATALFVLDATATLARRIARREKLSQAHRSHWYQRPLAFGMSHRTITLAAYPGMASVGALAIAYAGASPLARWIIAAAAAAVFVSYASAVRAVERGGSAARLDG